MTDGSNEPTKFFSLLSVMVMEGRRQDPLVMVVEGRSQDPPIEEEGDGGAKMLLPWQ